jgi:hypothetical protein
LREQLDPRQPLKRLADTLQWSEFERRLGSITGPKGVRPSRCG